MKPTESRLVVVGYGLGLNQRLQHCEAIRRTRGLRLYGICEPDDIRREEARRAYGVLTYADLDDVLADDRVDAVVVATPNESHASIALRCLEAKKHVILEKPMCLTTAEADSLIEASRRKGRLLTVRHNRRLDGDFLTVKEVLQQGQLGRIVALDSAINTLFRPSDWRAQKSLGGGEFVDWGCHLVDQVLQLVPSSPVSAFAVMASCGWEVDVETYCRLIIRFENGTASEVETSNISWLPRPRWYVLGEKGSLLFWDGKFRLRTKKGDTEITPRGGNYNLFYANISDALNEGNELLIKPEEVRLVIFILEAAFLSAATGQAVPLRPPTGGNG